MPLLRTLLGKRAIKSTDAPFDQILTETASSTGKNVTPHQSMRVAAVYAAVRLLAESVSSLPASLILREAGRRTVQEGPLAELLTVAPNPEQDAPEFYRAIMGWMLLEGNAYAYIERDRSTGEPVGLWPLPAPSVTVGRTPARRLYYDLTLTPLDAPAEVPTMTRVGPESILHYKAFGVGTYGLSPIRQVREAVATSLSAQEYMGRFYKQDASPGGVLSVPGNLDDEQFDRLKKQWKASHGGVERSHLLAILEGGTKWESVGLNPNDAAFIETQKWETVEIARAFGVPPHMIGDVERSTSWGSGIAEQGIGFVTYTLTPWITRLEWVARRGLLADLDERLRLKWRVDGLQRGDTKARYDAYAIGRNWGWLSTNDVRTLEDMDPVDGGDVYLQPLNMVPAATTSEPETEPDRQASRARQQPDIPASAVMVALYPPADVADQLAVDGGLDPEDLHITLAYLGRELDDEQVATATSIVGAAAAQHRPLAGVLGGGIGQFPAGDDGTPVWAPVDVPGLAEFRSRLVEQLQDAGIPVATDHGFTPHLTLTYLGEDETEPDTPAAYDVTFDVVTLKAGDERTGFTFTGSRQRRVRRSSAGRKRIASTFAPLIEDADRKIAKIERQEVGRLVREHLEGRDRSIRTFTQAVRDLYDGTLTERTIERWGPIFTAFASEIAADAADEAGVDPPELDRWVQAYVSSHVAYRAGSATSKLSRLATADNAADAVRGKLDEWVDDRPGKTARWESTQMSRAAARETWRGQGIREMVWIASGACDLCAELDGKTVGIEQAFVSQGDTVQGGEGQEDLQTQRDTFHPPLHPGCDCDVVPA